MGDGKTSPQDGEVGVGVPLRLLALHTLVWGLNRAESRHTLITKTYLYFPSLLDQITTPVITPNARKKRHSPGVSLVLTWQGGVTAHSVFSRAPLPLPWFPLLPHLLGQGGSSLLLTLSPPSLTQINVVGCFCLLGTMFSAIFGKGKPNETKLSYVNVASRIKRNFPQASPGYVLKIKQFLIQMSE